MQGNMLTRFSTLNCQQFLNTLPFLPLFLRNLPRPVQSYPGRREGRHTRTD